jgi:hypothetical protein
MLPGCKATSRLARSPILAEWQVASADQTAKGGEADALKGGFDGVGHAAGIGRIDVLLVTR